MILLHRNIFGSCGCRNLHKFILFKIPIPKRFSISNNVTLRYVLPARISDRPNRLLAVRSYVTTDKNIAYNELDRRKPNDGFSRNAENDANVDEINNMDEYEYEKEMKRRRDSHWRIMKYGLLMFGSLFGLVSMYLIYVIGAPKLDEFGNTIEDDFSALPAPLSFIRRVIREIEHLNNMIRQPATNKLLPDLPGSQYLQPKYTLVIELSDLLIHAEWTYQTGWRFKKRPGVDRFLELLSYPEFELVVICGEHYSTVFSLLEPLDPNHCIQFKLGKESTQFVDGCYVKNLDCMNRDLSKIIVVDWSENCVKFHRNNALIIPRWTGQDDDTTLLDLAILLKTISQSDVDDVRDVLSYYSQFEDPIEKFRENQRRLLEHIEEERAKKRKPTLASKWTNTFIRTSQHADIRE